MSKVFLVFGPESSGNNLTSLILKTMNCYWEEPQELDRFLRGETRIDVITDNPCMVLIIKPVVTNGTLTNDPKTSVCACTHRPVVEST